MIRLRLLIQLVAIGAAIAAPSAAAQSVRLTARAANMDNAAGTNGILNSMTGPRSSTRDAAGLYTGTTAYRVSHFMYGEATGLYVDRMDENEAGDLVTVQRKLLVYADPANGIEEPDGPSGSSRTGIMPAFDTPLVRWTSPTSFIYRVWDGREVDPPTYHNYLIEGVDGETFTVRRQR